MGGRREKANIVAWLEDKEDTGYSCQIISPQPRGKIHIYKCNTDSKLEQYLPDDKQVKNISDFEWEWRNVAGCSPPPRTMHSRPNRYDTPTGATWKEQSLSSWKCRRHGCRNPVTRENDLCDACVQRMRIPE